MVSLVDSITPLLLLLSLLLLFVAIARQQRIQHIITRQGSLGGADHLQDLQIHWERGGVAPSGTSTNQSTHGGGGEQAMLDRPYLTAGDADEDGD